MFQKGFGLWHIDDCWMVSVPNLLLLSCDCSNPAHLSCYFCDGAIKKTIHIYSCCTFGIPERRFLESPFLSLSTFFYFILRYRNQVGGQSSSIRVTSWQAYFSHQNTSTTCLFSQFEFYQPKTFPETSPVCWVQLRFITYHGHKLCGRLKHRK